MILYLLMFNTFSSFLPGPPKNRLANHIRSLPNLLHADAIQQWEVALLGSSAAHIINLLSTGLKYTTSTSWLQVVYPPCAFTTTPILPLPSTILMVGVNDAPAATATSSSIEGTTPSSHKGQEMPSKCHQILPMLIPQPDITSRPLSPSCPSPSDTSTSFPIVAVPELAVPLHAQPE